ncbi:hypothetical protein [Streptomyces sp. NPDC054865]
MKLITYSTRRSRRTVRPGCGPGLAWCGIDAGTQALRRIPALFGSWPGRALRGADGRRVALTITLSSDHGLAFEVTLLRLCDGRPLVDPEGLDEHRSGVGLPPRRNLAALLDRRHLSAREPSHVTNERSAT